MSLVDADKNKLDRSAPSPNAPDLTAGPTFSFHYPALPDYDANTGAIDYNHTGATIQSAIDRASAIGGGTVTIKNGTYVLTDDLTVPSNIALVGQNQGSVTLVFSGPYGIKIAGTEPYSTGNISVTKGSAVVTNTVAPDSNATAWLSNLTTSHKINIQGVVYGITSIDSDSQLTLDTVYAGKTQTDIPYTAAIFANNIKLQNMTIVAPAADAINIDHAYTVKLDTLTIPGAGATAVSINDGIQIILDTIVCVGATTYGFYGVGIYNLNATRLVVEDCGSDGIYISACNNTVMTSCPSNANTGNGFGLYDSTDVALIICEADANSGDGLYTNNITSGAFIGGAFTNNTGNGITNVGASYCTFTAVIGRSNSGFGLYIDPTCTRTIVTASQLYTNTSTNLFNASGDAVTGNNQI